MSVRLEKVSKIFDDVEAVKRLSVEIKQGEFFSLLGPSGCGKTTTLRMIAGFDFPTSGRIFFGDRNVTFLKPNRRNAGMVFQNFALFPHMTVFENVAFGLRARKTDRQQITERVQKALQRVDLANLPQRKVTELSGGQQQRVALARAIVIEPEILLLDEPLSNLDAKLRLETRRELHLLQRDLGITTVYVTHDQEEALTLSDRMAVLKSGVCHQIGSPREIYEQPQDSFVAQFVGNSNILNGEVVDLTASNLQIACFAEQDILLQTDKVNGYAAGDKVEVSIRPENIVFITENATGKNVIRGTVDTVSISGSMVDYQVSLDAGKNIRVKGLLEKDAFSRKIGETVALHIDPKHIYILP